MNQAGVVDGHVHTNRSPDSVANLAAILAEAKRHNLAGLVLTDHNVLPDRARVSEIRQAGFSTLEGIEWATMVDKRSIHLLCYAPNFDETALAPLLAETRHELTNQALTLVAALEGKTSTTLDLTKLTVERSNSYIRRRDVITAFVTTAGLSESEAQSIVDEVSTAITFPELSLSPQDILSAVHVAGGVVSLAHPGAHQRSGLEPADHRIWMQKVVASLAADGLDAIEVRHVWHDLVARDWLAVLANRFKLLTTAGSDWHGGRWPGEVPLGSYGMTPTEWQALTHHLEDLSQINLHD